MSHRWIQICQKNQKKKDKLYPYLLKCIIVEKINNVCVKKCYLLFSYCLSFNYSLKNDLKLYEILIDQ